jgi:hypothetical protein
MNFAGSQLGDFRHVCAFFASSDDEYKTTLPFMRDGLAAGDRLVNFMPEDRPDHEDRLRAGGIDVDQAQLDKQLEVVRSEDAYMRRDGEFDGEGMLNKLAELLNKSRDLGFAVTRLIAHAEHVTEDADDADAFVQYESRLNRILPDYPDVVVCTYDLNKISSGVVMDVLRTHPMVIIGGVLQENPFFVPPDGFLREVDERRARRKATRGNAGRSNADRSNTARTSKAGKKR